MEETVVTPVDVDVGFEVDVEVDLAQDASSTAAMIKKVKPHQINLLFTFYLHFN